MKTSLNYTSFTNPKVALEIRTAMAHVLKTGEAVRLLNRNKQPWLLVTVLKDELGYRFAFLDVENNEQGHNILVACIRQWSDLDSLSFWSLNAEAYDLKEHPLVTVAREAAIEADNERQLEEEAARIVELHKDGVTHIAHTWGGVQHLIGYQRNWYGKRVMYVWNGPGQWHKVSPEALQMIHHVEVF